MSNNTNSGGASLAAMLTVLFVGLKLTNYITWSWWWVLFPVWIPVILAIVSIIIIALLRR